MLSQLLQIHVSKHGKLLAAHWFQNFVNLGLHFRHPAGVAGHTHNSGLETKRDVFAFVQIALTVQVSPNLDRKSPIGLWRDAPMQPLRQDVLKTVGLVVAKKTLAHARTP